VEETNIQYRERILNADAAFRKEAAALSRVLLGPVSGQLASKRLLIVADGILQYLPFAALPGPDLAENNDSEDLSYLIEDHEIVNLPSASVLGLIREETEGRPSPPKKVAVLADPVFEADDPRIKAKVTSIEPAIPSPVESGTDPATPVHRAISGVEEGFHRLPATRREADSIVALIPPEMGLKLIGFKASRAAVSGPELGQYEIVHFATHGFIDDDNPELSGLALSLFDEKGRQQNGSLRLHDIYNLKLPVELIVLSACESALGTEIRGEGLVGLVRGFMYAGAKRIMASLWKVEDKPTAELMKRFYRHLLEDGETPAKALQMAQLEMSKQQRWKAPYYWAAFILQGECN
jgi:CHAT domain-containing protein